MDQTSADLALSRGLISPDQHAQISAQNGVSSAADAGMTPAPSPTPIGVLAPPPAPILDAGPPAPEPRVDVGPITAVAPPPMPPAPAPAPPPGVSLSPHGATFYNQKTGAETPSPKPAALDPRVEGMNSRIEGLHEQQRIATAIGEAKESRAIDTANALHDERVALEAKASEHNAAKAIEDQKIVKQSADTQAAVDDYAASKVDPNRFWKNQSTGQTIIAALAVGLGGFANGFSHGQIQNVALDQINRRIDADIRAQEVDLQTKGKGVEAKRGVLHDMMQMGMSKEAAYSAARQVSLQNVEFKLKELAAKTDPQLEKLGTQQMLSTISTEIGNQRETTALIQKADLQRQAAAAASAAISARDYRDKRNDKNIEQGVEIGKLRQGDKKLDIEAKNSAGGGKDAAKEDAQYRATMNTLEESWKDAVSTNPSNRLTSWWGKLAATDNDSQNTGAVSTLVSTTKGEHDNSDTDAARVKTMLPQPGDDQQTLSKKYALTLARIAEKYPQASARALGTGPRVKTSAPPGEK